MAVILPVGSVMNVTQTRDILFSLDYFKLKHDSQRVAVASSYLKESAFSWWENLCRQSHPATRNWMAFTIALRERFQPLAASRTARAQLHNLRQDSMSVAEYSNKF